MKRKLHIYTLVILLLVFVGVGITIGFKKGWFAGLADVIQQPPGAAGQAKIKVSVYSGHPMEGNPLEGVRAYWREGEFNSGNQVCGTGQTDLSPYGGTQGGTTVKKADGVYSEFTINLEGNAGAVYYIRVDKDPFKSCAFYYFDTGGGRGNPEGVINNHAVKLSGLSSGDVVDLKFTTTADIVSPPIENPPATGQGALKGKVIDQAGAPIGGAKVVIAGEEGSICPSTKCRITDTSGEYNFPSLNPGEYTLVINKDCAFDKTSVQTWVTAGDTRVVPSTTLLPGGVPEGKVAIHAKILQASDGKPINGAKLALFKDGREVPPGGISDTNGNLISCPIEPGVYDLLFTADGYGDVPFIGVGLWPKETGQRITSFTVHMVKGSGASLYSLKGKVLEAPSMRFPAELLNAKISINPIEYRDGRWRSISGGTIAEISSIPTDAGRINHDGSFIFNQIDSDKIKPESVLWRYYVRACVEGYVQDDYIARCSNTVEVKFLPSQPIYDISSSPLVFIRKDANFAKPRIRGMVRDREGPVTDALICVEEELLDKADDYGYCYEVAKTQSDGTFEGELSVNYLYNRIRISVRKNGIETYYQPQNPEEMLVLPGFDKYFSIFLPFSMPREHIVTVEVVDGSTNSRIAKADVSLTYQSTATRFQPIFEHWDSQTGANGDPAQLKIYKPLKAGRYVLTVSANGYRSFETSYEPAKLDGEDTLKITLYNQATTIVVDFEFYQGLKRNCAPSDLKEVFLQIMKKISLSSVEEDVFPFPKINYGYIDVTKWAFYLNGIDLGGRDDIKLQFDERFGADKENAANSYRVVITFPDEKTKEEFAERTLRDDMPTSMHIVYMPLEDQQKVDFDTGRIAYDILGSPYNNYRARVYFEFCFKEGAKTPDVLLSLDDPLKIESEKDPQFRQGVNLMRVWIKKIGSSEAETSTAESNPGYLFKNSLLYLTNFPSGRYEIKSRVAGNPIDPRANSFEIGSEKKLYLADAGICYAGDYRLERQEKELNFVSLGRFNLTRDNLFRHGVLDSESIIKKAGITNLVFVTNQPETAVSYVEGKIKYCYEGQDKEISGKNIIFSDEYVKRITQGKNALLEQLVMQGAVSYQAGRLGYNGLEQISKKSFDRIFATLTDTDGQEKVFNALSESSVIGETDSQVKIQSISSSQSLYALTVAAYKTNGILLLQRLNQMEEGEAKNLFKALVRVAIETQGANTGDENLFAPAFNQPLSKTVYPAYLLKNGNWIKENYNNLNAGGKIAVRYNQVLSLISGNQAVVFVNNKITAFNNWVDSLFGTRDTGKIQGTVLKDNKPLADAVVAVGGKMAVTNSNGKFTLTKVPVGEQVIEIKDRKTSKNYNLLNTNQKINVRKNQTTTVSILVAK